MDWMDFLIMFRPDDARPRFWLEAPIAALLLALLLAPACKHIKPIDTRPLDQAGMLYRSIEELRALDITDDEVVELAKVRQSGISDGACVELIRIARGRKEPFSSADAIAGLRRVGVSEDTVLELSRLNQLGLWVGEAQAMRLTGLSDQVLIAVARRRAAGAPVLSGPTIAKLKNAGLSDAEILWEIERGATDAQAEEIIALRRRAAAPIGFVRQCRV